MPRKIFPEVIVKQNVQSVFKKYRKRWKRLEQVLKIKTPPFSQDIVLLFFLGSEFLHFPKWKMRAVEVKLFGCSANVNKSKLKVADDSWRFVKGVFTIYKNVPQNPVGLLGRFSGKFPGATEHPKKYPWFFGRDVPNENLWVFFLLQSSLKSVWRSIPGNNLPFLNFALHLP